MTVTWRASQENLDAIISSYAERSKNGNMAGDVRDWYQTLIGGLQAAITRGDKSWAIKPTKSSLQLVSPLPPALGPAGPVYVLTDAACMSACLDAVDLWTRFGAIPVGQETGADTLYMETRQVKMPSGLGSISLPMKVYSGRPRGNNQPVRPVHRYAGDISDTAALEVWAAGLPERNRRPIQK